MFAIEIKTKNAIAPNELGFYDDGDHILMVNADGVVECYIPRECFLSLCAELPKLWEDFATRPTKPVSVVQRVEYAPAIDRELFLDAIAAAAGHRK